MNKILSVLLLSAIFMSEAYAQVMPAEGAKLHYTLVGFSFPAAGGSQGYTLEIAWGNHTTEKAFEKERIITKEGTTNKIIADVPSFGGDYTWRVITKTSKKEKKGKLYHFATLPSPFFDTNITRIKVTKSAMAYRDAYFFVDCNRALYDMNGKMVWFLPSHLAPLPALQDLKVTLDGTITYITDGRLNEVTYDGKLLNRIPGDEVPNANLHHEGVKLKNGHYLALGNERVFWQENGSQIKIIPLADSAAPHIGGPFGTINEYNEKGKLVWQYNTGAYFLHSDIAHWNPAGRNRWQAHLNAFYYDEQNGHIYLGFRTVSRILKIQYPEGKVLSVFGRLYKEDEQTQDLDQDVFCQQHAMFIKDGKLHLFNNNGCSLNPVPKLAILEEDATEKYGVKKIWEYEMGVDVIKNMRSGGGNIVGLPGGAVFASSSTPYCDLAIVDQGKNLLWSAKSEKFDKAGNSWIGLPTYRAHILPDSASVHKMVLYGH